MILKAFVMRSLVCLSYIPTCIQKPSFPPPPFEAPLPIQLSTNANGTRAYYQPVSIYIYIYVHLSAAGMHAAMIVVGIVPRSVMYIRLSEIGSMSSIYCMNLLLTRIPTPAVYSFLPPAPLKNHV